MMTQQTKAEKHCAQFIKNAYALADEARGFAFVVGQAGGEWNEDVMQAANSMRRALYAMHIYDGENYEFIADPVTFEQFHGDEYGNEKE
jgi:hypothetical protein